MRKGRGVFKSPCYAEIAELIIAELIYEYVLGFYIAVYDFLFFEQLQRGADIAAELYYLFLGHLPVRQVAHEGLEELHPYENIAADAVFLFDHLVVLDADYVLNALEGFHEADLVNEALYGLVYHGSRIVGV